MAHLPDPDTDFASLDMLLSALKRKYSELAPAAVPEDIRRIGNALTAYQSARRRSLLAPLYAVLGIPASAPTEADPTSAAALDLLSAVEALPEFRRKDESVRIADPVDPGDDGEEDAPPEPEAVVPSPLYPHITAAPGDRILWIVGAREDQKRIAGLRRLLPTVRWEWAPNTDHEVRNVSAPLSSIDRRGALAVLLCVGDINHRQSNQVQGACRAADVPCMLIRTPGSGQIARALRDIDAILGDR